MNLKMNSTVMQKNAKKVIKKLRKQGSNICKTVNVKRGYWTGAKPNACNVNAIEFIQSNNNTKRYRLCFGYLVDKSTAVAHVWNFDILTNTYVDVTPMPSDFLGIYVDATDILYDVYSQTWDMSQMNPFVFTKTGRLQEFDYGTALKIAGIE